MYYDIFKGEYARPGKQKAKQTETIKKEISDYLMSQNTLSPSMYPPPQINKVAYQEYPKDLKKPGEPMLTVNNAKEEENAIARGYSDKPLGAPSLVLGSVPLTTAAATQDAYNSLKKQYVDAIDSFNLKYQEIELKCDALTKENEKMRRMFAPGNKGLTMAAKLALEAEQAKAEQEAAEAAMASGAPVVDAPVAEADSGF